LLNKRGNVFFKKIIPTLHFPGHFLKQNWGMRKAFSIGILEGCILICNVSQLSWMPLDLSFLGSLKIELHVIPESGIHSMPK
jgi:hypothetical protein